MERFYQSQPGELFSKRQLVFTERSKDGEAVAAYIRNGDQYEYALVGKEVEIPIIGTELSRITWRGAWISMGGNQTATFVFALSDDGTELHGAYVVPGMEQYPQPIWAQRRPQA